MELTPFAPEFFPFFGLGGIGAHRKMQENSILNHILLKPSLLQALSEWFWILLVFFIKSTGSNFFTKSNTCYNQWAQATDGDVKDDAQ